MRGEDWMFFKGCLSTLQALMRELNEALGANVPEWEVISFGAITEAISKDSARLPCLLRMNARF